MPQKVVKFPIVQQTKSQQANSFCMQSFSFFYVRFVVSSLQPWCEILRGHLASPGISTGVCVCVCMCVYRCWPHPLPTGKTKKKKQNGETSSNSSKKKAKNKKIARKKLKKIVNKVKKGGCC